jgi:hypothetical protein
VTVWRDPPPLTANIAATITTVCISHATGAEGEAVGRTVAERLGYRYVDDEVIEQAGEWVELAPEFVSDVERRKPFIARLLGAVMPSPTSAPVVPTRIEGRLLPSDEELRQLIKQVLTSFADAGSVVIVAHAASFALTGRDVLRVLVTGSPEARAARVAAGRGVDERAAARLIRDEDAARAYYLKQFYGVDQELPTHYDLVVNTDVLGAEQAAEIVVFAAGL